MTVVEPSRLHRDGLFGVLVAVFALAFVRGLAGAATSGGRIAVVLFAGGAIVVLLWAWIRSIVRPARLEISADAVTLVEPDGRRRTLHRASGHQIRVTVVGGGRYRRSALTIAGSGTVLPLGFFSVNEVQRQCVANGWQFSGPGRRTGR
jgi:uncharacterized membrane protein